DINLDGTVDSTDLGLLLNNFNKKVTAPADFDGDDAVLPSDFDFIADNWAMPVSAGTNGDATYDGVVDLADIELFDALWAPGPIVSRPAPPVMVTGDANNDGVVNAADNTLISTNLNTTVSAPFTDGDVDGDMDVDSGDLAIYLNNFGELFGDLNGDGRVDLDDAQILIGNIGSTPGVGVLGDLNEDNAIDSDDLKALGHRWRQIAPTQASPATAAPEPCSVLVLLFSSGAFATLRRRCAGRL
ncbi:MAG: dockerin type I domain-containing protein, partial [Planctomycetota bacterium]